MIKPGPLEIGLILLIILVVFGVGKLPQVGSAFGKAIRGFKQAQSGEDEEEAQPKKRTRRKSKKKVAKKVTEEKAEAKPEEKVEAKAEEAEA